MASSQQTARRDGQNRQPSDELSTDAEDTAANSSLAIYDHKSLEVAPTSQSCGMREKSIPSQVSLASHDMEAPWEAPFTEDPVRLECYPYNSAVSQLDDGQAGPKDPNLIVFDGVDDPANPLNWPRSRKWLITITMGAMTFCITFASGVFSSATSATAKLFDVSTEVTTLGTSLFVLGFAFGPLIWGPCSEMYGRKNPLFIGVFVFAVFEIPVVIAQNLYTILLCRFFGGMFGCAPLAIIGGALSDMWEPVDRSIAICVFAGSTFIGPILGPVIGAFITESYLGWRWTAYVTTIAAFSTWFVAIFIIPETYAPIILKRKAFHLRHATKNWAIHSPADEQKIDLRRIVHTYLLRPFIIFFQEPILILITIYMSLIYGILYLFFEALPISYQEQRGWDAGIGSLPFLAILVGVLLGTITIAISSKTRFARKLKQHGHVIPEERLPPMILGAGMLPIGLFWFAWTSLPEISWVPQVLSGILIGWGILMIFLQGLNYVIDVYIPYANSAIAANSFLRALAGAGFPLFAVAMYNKLGVPWATSLLGFLTLAMFPIPILFFIYGARIRKLSRFSLVVPKTMDLSN